MRKNQMNDFNNELARISNPEPNCGFDLSNNTDWQEQERLLKDLIVEEQKDVSEFEQKVIRDNQAIIDRSVQDGQRHAATQIVHNYPQWNTSFNA